MKNMVEFNFEMLKYYQDEEIDVCVSDGAQLILQLKAFEKYIFNRYMFNYLDYKFKLCNESPRLIVDLVSDFILRLSKIMHLKLNQTILNKYTLEISKISNIQNILKKNKKEDGVYKISISELAAQKNILVILKKLFSELYTNEIDKFNKIDVNTLSKSYYTQNFDYLINKMNITDKKIIELTRLSFYANISYFKNFLPLNTDKRSNLWFNASKLLGFNVQNIDIYKYKDTLFNYNIDGGIIDYFCFNNTLMNTCVKKYKNINNCLTDILIKIDNVELTKDDFKHIKQYDYIKTLLKNGIKNNIKGINILFYGKPGTGKSALAKTLMSEITENMYQVPVNEEHLNSGNGALSLSPRGISRYNDVRKGWYNSMQLLLRNSKDGIILYDEAEDFFRREFDAEQSKGIVNSILESNNIPTIWTTNSIECIEKSFLRRFTYTLNIDSLSKTSYQTIINKLTNKYKINLTDDINKILLQYKPSIGLTEKLIKNYKNTNKNLEEFKQDLFDSLKCLNSGNPISKLPINKFNFNPELINSSIDLNDLTASIKQSGRLDFSLLLYGVPGSSKTSYGRYLAEELGLPVINKSYTELSSMWVGETEKNIAKLFEEAEQEKALILLDECDALLQDRTKAYRSWEISQTEALLTAMEFHPYPFIMTTNLYNNLDPAVMRRILYKVKHDYLKSDQIKLAFKHFFNIDINEDLHLSKLTAGDFAVIKKQAEFQNKLTDKKWLIERLIDEMNQKKAEIQNEIKF